MKTKFLKSYRSLAASLLAALFLFALPLVTFSQSDNSTRARIVATPTIVAIYSKQPGEPKVAGKIYPEQEFFLEVTGFANKQLKEIRIGTNLVVEAADLTFTTSAGEPPRLIIAAPGFAYKDLPSGTLAIQVVGSGWETAPVRAQFFGGGSDSLDAPTTGSPTGTNPQPTGTPSPSGRPRTIGNTTVAGGLSSIENLFGGTGEIIKSRTLGQAIRAIVNGILALTAVVALGMIVLGGFWYITSAGNPDRVKQARAILKYAVYGIVIVVLAYTIVITLTNTVKNFPGN